MGMRKMRRLLAALIVMPLVSGCFWAVAGGAGAAGTYVWMNGNLSRNYTQPMETAWEGTLHALRVLQLPVEERKHDAFFGVIKARMAKRDEIMKITLERWTDTETKISVRAGVFGDRKISERVHEEIEKALK